jgi:cell division protein FtsI/penicillin-binding protein 2
VADKTSNDWRATLKRRLTVAFCLLLAWSVAIEARLVYLQVFRYADLTARADRQQSRTIPSPAKRGEILDRNGRILARSVDAGHDLRRADRARRPGSGGGHAVSCAPRL